MYSFIQTGLESWLWTKETSWGTWTRGEVACRFPCTCRTCTGGACLWTTESCARCPRLSPTSCASVRRRSTGAAACPTPPTQSSRPAATQTDRSTRWSSWASTASGSPVWPEYLEELKTAATARKQVNVLMLPCFIQKCLNLDYPFKLIISGKSKWCGAFLFYLFIYYYLQACVTLQMGNYVFCTFISGNTYDRSLVVDDEETSILLYDIWEQVSNEN